MNAVNTQSTPQDGRFRLDWTKLEPPPYLLGASMVFWGFLSDHPLLGVAVALVLESHRWIRWRWAFSDQDYVRVWNLCVTLFLMVAVFQVVGQEMGRWQVTRTFQQWMPILLFPIIWAQNFSRGEAVPLITFSLVARRKRTLDVRAGRQVQQPRRANLGYFYFAVLLLSIGALSRQREATLMGDLLGLPKRVGFGSVTFVYVMVTLLLGWALIALVPRRRWLAAGCLLVLASFSGHHVHTNLRMLHGLLELKTMEWITGRDGRYHKRYRTQIGEVGEVKQSSRVFWRVEHVEGTVPTLLPEATYHDYSRRHWRNRDNSLRRVIPVEGRNQWEIENIPTVDSTSSVIMRGYASGRVQVLPRLEDTALIYDLEAHSLQRNPMGTLMAEPTYRAMKYTLYAGELSPGKLEAVVNQRRDRLVSKEERNGLVAVVESLNVPVTATSADRVKAVEGFFANPANGFSYTKYLSGAGVSQLGSDVTDLGRFLDAKGRAGHCEYYATATVLLLRQLGVPARYVVGYALQEYDPEKNEYLLRGTHRHAWAKAWLDEESRWVNVDTTPAVWMTADHSPLSASQRWRDRWDAWMLSWNLWRRDDNKGLWWTLLPLLLAGALLIVVVIRLFRGLKASRRDALIHEGRDLELERLGIDSAWFELERLLGERYGTRPPNQSVEAWTRQLANAEAELPGSLPTIVATHYRYRFDPEGLSGDELTEFKEKVGALMEELAVEELATA